MKSLLYAVLSLLILSQTVIADDKSAAEEALKSKLEGVISVLQKKEIEHEAKKKEIMEIVTPIFDFSLMAKLTLGRKFWPGLAKEKKERFSELFIKRLKESYLEKLTRYTYSDEKIVYNAPIQVKKRIHIPTDLISKDNKISMLYKLYKSKQNWKIYDIEIEGVSLITTYRSQFDQVLSKGTIDDLLKKLEEPENKQSAS
ncbi:MAG: ABC transporter substrate-binding protein [Desulfobacterales bacterium]|nr:MAG: ABC transporter substrate-binding protein [Desulfobacterales bacterium]